MYSDSSTVRRTVGLLAQRLRALPFPASVTGQELVMILLGLQHMGSEHREVQAMLLELSVWMEVSEVRLTGAELSSALFSLKSMGGGKPINFNLQRLKDRPSLSGSASASASESVPGQEKETYHFRQVYSAWTDSSRNGLSPGVGVGTDGAGEEEGDTRRQRRDWVGTDPDPTQLLFSCTKRRYRLPSVLIRLLSSLEKQLAERPAALTSPQVTTALFGLQGLTADSVQVNLTTYHCVASVRPSVRYFFVLIVNRCDAFWITSPPT